MPALPSVSWLSICSAVEWMPPPDAYSYQLAVKKTAALIANGEKTIYEAAFQIDGVLCAVDILVKKGTFWYAFEVKSTLGVKVQHVQDAALQYHVLTQAGLELKDISIVHLNREYVRRGLLDIEQLFTMQSVLEEVLEQQEFIQNKITELKTVLTHPDEPIMDIGAHCFTPYGCDFTDHCWSHIPKEDSVFDLPFKPALKLYEAGYKHLDDIPDEVALSKKATLQLQHYKSGEVFIDHEAITNFLAPLTYPLYFLDFETIMPGIPQFEGQKPFQQIPFQFSLHIQQSEGASLEHVFFLGDGKTDPRLPLIEKMLQHMGTTGTILSYNMTFERNRIKELAYSIPQYKSELLALNNRMVDLMIPFQKRWYYHPNFKGSYSIKTILPILIPQLRYDRLPINEGGLASLVYSQLKYQDTETQELQREQLLAYCELDTVAMVEVLGFLRGLKIQEIYSHEL